MPRLGLQWHYDVLAVKAEQNVHLLLWGPIRLVQATVKDWLIPGELALPWKTHGEIQHGLLWALLAAVPLHAGISKRRGRQGTLGDAIIRLSGTRGSMPADASCWWQSPWLGFQSSGWPRRHLQPLKPWPGCWGTSSLALG